MTKVKTSKPAVAKKDSTRSYLKRYWQLYLLLSLPLLYLLVFKYIPMVYIQIAFKKYSIIQNVWEMPWAKNHGFEYFIQAFRSNDFRRTLRNTVVLNLSYDGSGDRVPGADHLRIDSERIVFQTF